MERSVVHIDMNTFFVSCERLTNSALNGIPLIIGGGERGVVASSLFDLLKTKFRGDVLAKDLLKHHKKTVRMLAYLVSRKHVPTKWGLCILAHGSMRKVPFLILPILRIVLPNILFWVVVLSLAWLRGSRLSLSHYYST